MSARRLARTSPQPGYSHADEQPSLPPQVAMPEQHLATGVASHPSLSALHITYAVATFMALAGTFALTAAVAMHPGPLPGDVGFTVWWQHVILPHAWLTRLLEIDSTLNWPQPAAIIVATTVALFVVLARWLDALLALATVGAADATNFTVNQIIQRPRPLGFGVFVDRYISGVYSFPSGHVEHAVAFFGIVLFLTFQVRRTGMRATVALWIVRAALILGIVLMGPSRVLMGEHWPSDCLAGLLWGGFWLLIAILVYRWMARRWPWLLGIAEPQP